MHPILFTIGGVTVASYNAALAGAIFAGVIAALRRARRLGVQADIIVELACVMAVSALAGSRLWAVVLHRPLDWSLLWKGSAGFSMTGGVALCIVIAWGYLRIMDQDFLLLGDVAAPSFLLEVGIMRLGGCFLAGCCFGVPTTSPIGIVFPPGCPASRVFPGMPLWPAQLFAAFLGFAGFALVLWLDRYRSFRGYTFGLVALYYPVDRFVVDQFRYYDPSYLLGTLGPLTLTVNHLVYGALFLLAAVCWITGWRKAHHYPNQRTSSL